MVQLVRAGRTPAELAKEFKPSAQTIRRRAKQADLEDERKRKRVVDGVLYDTETAEYVGERPAFGVGRLDGKNACTVPLTQAAATAGWWLWWKALTEAAGFDHSSRTATVRGWSSGGCA
jgi:hypothetical protein